MTRTGNQVNNLFVNPKVFRLINNIKKGEFEQNDFACLGMYNDGLSYNEIIEARDEDGKNLLQIAIEYNSRRHIEFFTGIDHDGSEIENFQDYQFSGQDNNGDTLFHTALEHSFDIFFKLLDTPNADIEGIFKLENHSGKNVFITIIEKITNDSIILTQDQLDKLNEVFTYQDEKYFFLSDELKEELLEFGYSRVKNLGWLRGRKAEINEFLAKISERDAPVISVDELINIRGLFKNSRNPKWGKGRTDLKRWMLDVLSDGLIKLSDNGIMFDEGVKQFELTNEDKRAFAEFSYSESKNLGGLGERKAKVNEMIFQIALKDSISIDDIYTLRDLYKNSHNPAWGKGKTDLKRLLIDIMIKGQLISAQASFENPLYEGAGVFSGEEEVGLMSIPGSDNSDTLVTPESSQLDSGNSSVVEDVTPVPASGNNEWDDAPAFNESDAAEPPLTPPPLDEGNVNLTLYNSTELAEVGHALNAAEQDISAPNFNELDAALPPATPPLTIKGEGYNEDLENWLSDENESDKDEKEFSLSSSSLSLISDSDSKASQEVAVAATGALATVNDLKQKLEQKGLNIR